MGVKVFSLRSDREFYLSYTGFYHLRRNIAYAISEEFGELYVESQACIFLDECVEADFKIREYIQDNHTDIDIVDFLFSSTTEGAASPETCKKIYDLIEKIEIDERFQFATHAYKNDWKEFKNFLLDCYNNKVDMEWK